MRLRLCTLLFIASLTTITANIEKGTISSVTQVDSDNCYGIDCIIDDAFPDNVTHLIASTLPKQIQVVFDQLTSNTSSLTSSLSQFLELFVDPIKNRQDSSCAKSLQTIQKQLNKQNKLLNSMTSTLPEIIETLQRQQETQNELMQLLQKHDERAEISTRLVKNQENLLCSLLGYSDDVTCVRLVEGTNSSAGRVEILYGGEWGTVCDNGWDSRDAEVVCRQLGYPFGDVLPKRKGHFGQGAGQIWLDNVTCTGSERSLWDCEHSGWGVKDCQHHQDAGVICYPPVRLVNGSDSRQGRVEVFYDDAWGTVCDDDWGEHDAQVVCRQLGYPYGGAVAKKDGYFGHGSGQILLDNVNCRGDEESLWECSHNKWGSNDCLHSEDAGVVCTDTPIRLVGGRNPREGRVEVLYDGQWGTICADNWKASDAMVVCRQLGHPHTHRVRAKPGGSFGRGVGPILMSNVACTGQENYLGECRHNGWGISNCGHYQLDAGVICR